MSVVAALSSRLVHTNRRSDGAWRQDYAHGIPVTDLVPIAPAGGRGTTVRFQVDPDLVDGTIDVDRLRRICGFPWLAVEVVVEAVTE